MARSHANKITSGSLWRALFSYLFIVLASICLVASIITRYVNSTFLNTTNFVEITQELPQNDQVATALATKLVDELFNSEQVQQNVTEFLPDKLKGLAAPLANILHDKAYSLTFQFIKGSQFNTVWRATNQFAHEKLIELAESEPRPSRDVSQYQLKIQSILNTISQRFSDNSVPTIDQAKIDQAKEIAVSTKLKINQWRSTVKTIRFGAAILPLMFLAFILAGIAIARMRRIAVLVSGSLTVLVGVIMLIFFKVGSSEVLNDITNPTNRSAADVIYEAFYSGLRTRISVALTAGLILIILAIFFGPYKWAQTARKFLKINKIKNARVYDLSQSIRKFTKSYLWWFLLAGLFISFVVLLLASEISLSFVVNTINILVIYGSLVFMLANRTPKTVSTKA